MQNIYLCICKTIGYVLHKYMFLHMQKYIPCTKHSFAYAKCIVLRMYMVLHAAPVLMHFCTKFWSEMVVRWRYADLFIYGVIKKSLCPRTLRIYR